MIKDLNKVSIVDLDTGNINSIINMLKKIGIDSKSYSDPNKAIKSDILIIPGIYTPISQSVKTCEYPLPAAGHMSSADEFVTNAWKW